MRLPPVQNALQLSTKRGRGRHQSSSTGLNGADAGATQAEAEPALPQDLRARRWTTYNSNGKPRAILRVMPSFTPRVAAASAQHIGILLAQCHTEVCRWAFWDG